MFKVFSFGFETCNKTISPLINRLINEALLVADHISNRCHFRSWHTLLVSDKHVPAFLFQSVSLGSGALVWFSCSQGWKYMVHRTITVMSCCSNSCCHTSVKLLATFTFQCTTRAQEHRAAVTQYSALHTRHAAFQQSRPQSCRLLDMDSHSGIRNTDKLRLLIEWHIIFHKVG